MRKSNTKIIVGIILFVAAIAVLLYFFPNILVPQTAIGYSNQCSLTTCPTGYTESNTYCSDTSNTCYRTCSKLHLVYRFHLGYQ